MADFQNEMIESKVLPTVDHIDYESIEKNFLYVRLISVGLLYIVITFIVAALLISGEVNFDFPNIWAFLVILFLLGFNIMMTILSFRKRKFAIRQYDIGFKKGLIWQSHITIPFNRVQHCEVNQGILDRVFELSRLKIYTAGGSNSDLTIAGLNPVRADQMKSFILQKTIQDEEE